MPGQLRRNRAQLASMSLQGSSDTVCAVVVTHNRLSLLRECVQSIQQQTHRPFDVIIVNNGSSDGTVEWLAAQRNLTVINQPNLGGAGGFHSGIRRALHSAANWIWCLDDDTIPQNDCLEELLKAAKASTETLNEMPVVLCSDVRWTDGSVHVMNKPWLRPNKHVSDRERREPLFIRACTFCSALISADAVRQNGLPFKDFFIWADDFEYTARILRHNVGLFVPASVVTHKTKTNYMTINDTGPRHYFSIRNNIWILRFSNGLTKREKAGNLRHLLAIMIVRYLLAHQLAIGSVKAVVRGVRDGLFSKPDLSDDLSRSESRLEKR